MRSMTELEFSPKVCHTSANMVFGCKLWRTTGTTQNSDANYTYTALTGTFLVKTLWTTNYCILSCCTHTNPQFRPNTIYNLWISGNNLVIFLDNKKLFITFWLAKTPLMKTNNLFNFFRIC